jgi:hypothetical protein
MIVTNMFEKRLKKTTFSVDEQAGLLLYLIQVNYFMAFEVFN